MTNKTKPTADHFQYLDALRTSGETNMYGARPYLQEQFGLEKVEASTILIAWMKTFDGKTTPAERAAIAKAQGGR